MEKTLRIGWIGTGVMGAEMAAHVLDEGWGLTVFNRTRAKAEPLLAKGANWADSPGKVAESSDIVFSIVGYPADVEQIACGEGGVLHCLPPDGIFCDMTTSSPELAQRISEEAIRLGCHALDAPVTGGDVGARSASLSIFVGGETAAFERIRPILLSMGKNIMHCGSSGSGQKAKLANQIAVAGVMFSVCESLLFAREADLDIVRWLDLVVRGAGGSTAMNTLGRRLLKDDFEPGFFVDHFIKDLGLCLQECRRMNIVLPGLTLADELYRMMQAEGRGQNGTQALIAFLARLSGKKWGEQ